MEEEINGTQEETGSALQEELTQALISMMLIGPDANEETVRELAMRVTRLIRELIQESSSQPSKSDGPAPARDD
jgi:hypothetical protein